MKTFLVLWYGEQMTKPPSPEEGKAIIEAWGKYLGGLGANGTLVNGSAFPVMPGGKMITPKGTVDYKSEKLDVNGCLILKAKDYAEAVKIVKGAPEMERSNVLIREAAEVQRS
jgi:hypothetical protein